MVLRKEITTQIKDILKKNPQGLSITEIVRAIGINRNTAGRYLENLLVSGQVEMRRFGMAKIYMLSQRVPLSAVLSISSELVLQLDNNLRIVFTNEPFLDLIGTDEKELLGKNIEYTPVTTVLDDSFPWLLRKIQDGLNGKEASGNISLRLKDLIFFYRIAPTVFEDGRKGVSVILENITEQRRADDALRESEDRYRKLVEISPDAVFLHREGTIIYANPAAFRLLGASRSGEIIGKNILDFIDPDFRDIVRINIQKDLEGQMSPRTELHMVRIDGASIIVEGRGIATVSDGKPAVQVATRDITEQKQAEIALRESEEKYRTLVNRANDVICVIQDGIVKMCNPRLTEFWGGPVEEMLGRPFTDFVHPDALSKVVNRYNRRMAGENTPPIYQTILKRKDGSRFYAELNAGVVSYEAKPADLVIIRDINERKKAEEVLRESESTARALLNAPTDSVILMDAQGVILALNETAALRFGKRSDELVGILADDLLPEEVAQSRRSLVAQVIEKKEMVRFEDERDGRWYDTVAYPIVSETGEVKKIAVIARDITDLKHAQRTLIKSEQRFRNLVTATGDIVWETDTEARFVYVSPQVESIIGYKSEELVGHTPFEFLQPDAVEPNKKKFRIAIENKDKSIIHISHWIHKDGHDVLLESHAVPIYRSDGSFSGFLGIDRQQ